MRVRLSGAYYNEIDPFAAAWLRKLIKAGLIADGEVDERSIADVAGDDVSGFAQVHWFAGIGGWSYALRQAGWADDRPVWTGSCPCQPFSLAGSQKGFDDKRHLWPEFKRLIGQCSPPEVFGEQVASATSWLSLVRSDLEALDYAVAAVPIQAASAGAYHLRDRYWFVGHNTRDGRGAWRPEYEVWRGWSTASGDGSVGVADANQPIASEEWEQRIRKQCGFGGDSETCNSSDLGNGVSNRWRAGRNNYSEHDGAQPSAANKLDWVIGADGKARCVKPGVRLLAHGISNRVGKLRGFGNAIDPRPAAAFIRAYMQIAKC